jgi:hypothetical protein
MEAGCRLGRKRRSHDLCELGECGDQSERRSYLGGEFVVAAAQVPNEGMAAGDPRD